MRHQTEKFIQKFIEEKAFSGRVLDVGAAYLGGARLWKLFPDGAYEGLDFSKGQEENVNHVMNAHEIRSHFEPEIYDLVMSFDTFEHDDKFWETLEGMKYVLKKGGYMLIGVPSRACPAHDHPKDYWRFMPHGMESFFEGFTDFYMDVQTDSPEHFAPDEIYGWGKKI